MCDSSSMKQKETIIIKFISFQEEKNFKDLILVQNTTIDQCN